MRVTAGANTTVTNTACVENTNEVVAHNRVNDVNNCNVAVLRTPTSTCTTGCGNQLQYISVAKINNITFACQGNAQARSF